MSDERREGGDSRPRDQGTGQGSGQGPGKRRFGKGRRPRSDRPDKTEGQDGQERQARHARHQKPGDAQKSSDHPAAAQGTGGRGQQGAQGGQSPQGNRGRQRQRQAAPQKAQQAGQDRPQSAQERPAVQQRPHYQVPKLPKPEPLPEYLCAICQKPIFDLAGALSDRESGEPVHFDCALERVSLMEELAPEEKIVYLGAGSFGVVAPTGERPDGAFTVKRRIAWEKEGEKKDWRRQISSTITNLTKA